MRQPLVAIMRMAKALIQCVMRTMSGWILTQCDCAVSIERPPAPVPPWSKTIAYTLQRRPPVAFAKAFERRVEPPRQGDRLEQLSHLRRAHQPVRLVRERQEFLPVLGRGARHHFGDAAVDEELRLARVSGELEPGLARGRGDSAEVDVTGDVLQPRQKERVGVRIVAVVAHERAVSAL